MMTVEHQGTWSGSTLVDNKYVAFVYNAAGQTTSITDYALVGGTNALVGGHHQLHQARRQQRL